jgi:hypothetical protein
VLHHLPNSADNTDPATQTQPKQSILILHSTAIEFGNRGTEEMPAKSPSQPTHNIQSPQSDEIKD